MTGAPDRSHGLDRDLDTDLVEYFIVTTPVPELMKEVGTALADLVDDGLVQVLDIVLIAIDPATDRRRAFEIDEISGLAKREEVCGPATLLSEHDIQMVAASLDTTEAALVVVVESRWAVPLSVAAQRGGGRIVGGERVPRGQVAAPRTTDAVRRSRMDLSHPASDRRRNIGLLTRPPATGKSGPQRAGDFIADPVEQIRELTELADQGLLSEEDVEHQKRRILED